jgi:hypothetical protein
MQNSFDQINHHDGSSVPLQKREEGFDYWVRLHRSIIQSYENSLIARSVQQRGDAVKESNAEEYNSGWQWDNEGRWLDDGGESGEVV